MTRPDSTPRLKADLVRDLNHDVGKHIARTAINLASGSDEALRPEILRMLVKDLYAIDGRRSALSVFQSLSENLPQAPLAATELCLEEIDSLEPQVRKGDPPSVARARDLALLVRAQLLSLLPTLPEGLP